MDNVKYEISLKNRLLPFLATKEISEILNDIKSDSNENGDLESIYGKSGTFAKEILKDKRKNLDYIIENALIICIMILTNVYLRNLPLWIYSVIRAAEYAVLFLSLTKDYLVKSVNVPASNKKKVFWIIEAGMITIGIILNGFMFLIRPYYEAAEKKYNVGHAINILSYSTIVIALSVLLFSLIRYIIRRDLWYGGIFVQSALYIEMAFMFMDRASSVVTEEDIYVGNYALATVLVSVFAILYYYKRTGSRIRETMQDNN